MYRNSVKRIMTLILMLGFIQTDNEMRLQMTNKAKNPIDSFVENAKKRRKRPLSDDQINKINELIIDAEKEEGEEENSNEF
jgi:hypothetical protein